MKFFSNDAKENTDGPDYDGPDNRSDYDRDRTDLVTSDPVAVPQQRAGSPWTDAPAGDTTDTARGGADAETDFRTETDSDAELAEQERRDGTDEDVPTTDDRLEAPAQPGSEGDDSYTSEAEGLHRAEDDDLDKPATDDSHEAEGDHEAKGDHAVDEHEAAADHPVDESLKDEGTFDSPEAVEPTTGEPLDSASVHDEADKDEVNGAPLAVEPEPVPLPALEPDTATATATASSSDDDVPVVAAVPVETAGTPGSTPAPALDKLFADGDDYADRFRDIQLRFVDSPKEATAEAAALVGEAVDKLTAALTSQRDALSGGDTEDTEKLRVELRGYRDLLNRLRAL
jgi:hypothetical protein